MTTLRLNHPAAGKAGIACLVAIKHYLVNDNYSSPSVTIISRRWAGLLFVSSLLV